MNDSSHEFSGEQLRWLDDAAEAFDAQWRDGPAPAIEAYLADQTDSRRRSMLARELVLIDLERRWRAGQAVSPDEYARRFPEILQDDGSLPDDVVLYADQVRSEFGAADDSTLANHSPSADQTHCLQCGAATEPNDNGPAVECDQCGAALARVTSSANISLPATLGHFQLLEHIGTGGFGDVYRARDARLGRTVAVKLPRERRFRSSGEEQRFQREARHAASLQHPAIVQVHEVVELDGVPAIVSEFVDGRTLAEMLAESGPLRPDRAAALVARVAEGLEYAHQHQILHRDVKPANILVNAQGKPQLTDFGLARHGHDASGLTLAGQVFGTPSYMPPEQALGDHEQLGPQSDVYSVGAVLYELLCGAPPFAGDTAGVLARVISEPVTRPRQLNSAIPRDLELICLKALEKEPRQRYHSAGELAADLRRFLRDESIVARPPRWSQRIARWIRRHPAISTAVGCLSLMTIGLGIYAYTRPGVLAVTVKPAGARVRVGGESFVSDGSARQLRLAAGEYRVEASADDHEPDGVDVVVSRNQVRSKELVLEHHQGQLDIECRPGSSSLLVNGRVFGSRIPKLPFDTGKYWFVASAPDHFIRRSERTLQRSLPLRNRFWLDRGVLWRRRSATLQGAYHVAGDVDQDGAPDVVHMEVGRLVVFSGRSGELLATYPIPTGGQASFDLNDLGGTIGECVVIGHVIAGADRGHRLTVDVFRNDSFSKPLWNWPGPPNPEGTRNGMRCEVVGDCNADGVREVLVLAGAESAYLLSGRDGTELRHTHQLAAPGIYQDSRLAGGPDSDHLLIRGSSADESTDQLAAVALPGLDVVWTKHVARDLALRTVDADGDGVRDWLYRGPRHWGVFEGLTGKRLWEHPFPEEVAELWPFARDDGLAWLAVPADSRRPCFAVDSSGRLLWRGPPELLVRQPAGRDYGLLLSGRKRPMLRPSLLLVTQRELVAVQPSSGGVAWTFPGKVDSVMCGDLEKDGIGEVLFYAEQPHRLVCLTDFGAPRWELPVGDGEIPRRLVPDVDGDRRQEILAARHAGSVLMVRAPRVLWQVEASALIQATPQLADVTGDGVADVIQQGVWPEGEGARALNGVDGDTIWPSRMKRPPNRPPRVVDFDGDQIPDVVSLSGPIDGDQRTRWQVRRGDTGVITTEITVPPGTVYCQPIVADFTGDGVADIATMRYSSRDVILVDGKTRELAWTFDTPEPNLGAIDAGDLNRDGRLDLVVPCGNGTLFALDGVTGRPIWHVSCGGFHRGAPLVCDINKDGQQDVLLIARPPNQPEVAELLVVNGATGAIRWKFTCPEFTECLGRPCVIDHGDDRWIICGLGRAGAAAISIRDRKPVWIHRTPARVVNRPVVGDLDHDKVREVIVVTENARLQVLDLTTGAPIWDYRIPGGGKVEADPAFADLNQDGRDDILVAHDIWLSAISGQSLTAARRGLPLK